jgi:hypothetical protein
MNQLLRVQPKKNPHHQKSMAAAEQDGDSDGGADEAPYTIPLIDTSVIFCSSRTRVTGGWLEMKHKLAMESYIQQKMTIGAGNATSEAANSSGNVKETNHCTRNSPTRHDTYQRAFEARTRCCCS